jgi:signal transduction histidine kinase
MRQIADQREADPEGLAAQGPAGAADPSGTQGQADRVRGASVWRRRQPPGVRSTFRIIRYFSVASLVCILIATLALAVHFRQAAIREMVQLGEAANVALAEAALNAMRPQLLEFLDKAASAPRADLAGLSLPPALAHEVADLMRVESVAKIKIYDRLGLVVYATRSAEIGRDQRDNPGVIAAMSGQVASQLVYRDAFNILDRESEEDNLIQTYLPVLGEPDLTPHGVFELYTDVNRMVEETERAQRQILVEGALIMALLYVALLMVVRYAARTISRQQQEIRDYAGALERISARILSTQEEEKKRIAFDLHESVAQTLMAVKLHVEQASLQVSGGKSGDAAQLQRMVQAVRDAIDEVRSLALNLRPSSLDELGLLATITWFCRELAGLHPGIAISHQLAVAETDVPQPLKVIIYRVLEETCRALSRQSGITHIQVSLAADEGAIALAIEHDARSEVDADAPLLAAARERILLSGGLFDGQRNATGRETLRATWRR